MSNYDSIKNERCTMSKKEIFSIPNILCYIRFLLVFVFSYLYWKGEYEWGAAMIVLGGITDCLDGQIARRCDMITELGKIIDPLADKAMQLAIVIALYSRYSQMIGLFILFIIKEAFQGICCMIGLKKGRRLNGAKWYGKVATAVFYVVTVILIACYELPLWLIHACMLVTFIVFANAFMLYAVTFYRLLKH